MRKHYCYFDEEGNVAQPNNVRTVDTCPTVPQSFPHSHKQSAIIPTSVRVCVCWALSLSLSFPLSPHSPHNNTCAVTRVKPCITTHARLQSGRFVLYTHKDRRTCVQLHLSISLYRWDTSTWRSVVDESSMLIKCDGCGVCVWI